MRKIDTNIFNNLFYIVLFLGFVLPSNTHFYIALGGIKLTTREFAFLLLPIINLFCYSRNNVKVADQKLQYLIFIFLGIVFITELLKIIHYHEGMGNMFKTIRIGLPLFSSLILLSVGIRADIERVWRTLLWAISTSAVLTLFTPFVHLPIYPAIDGTNIIEAASGRFINTNFAFGIIGLYLLYRDKDKWYNQGWLPFVTSTLSIIILIFSFNRTYLALAFFAGIYLTYSTFSLRHVIRYLAIVLLCIGVFWGIYNYSNVVHHQINKRILSIAWKQNNRTESLGLESRTVIYSGILQKIGAGYWTLGLPLEKKIFYRKGRYGVFGFNKTDTSLVNIDLRYGIITLIIFGIILSILFKRGSHFFKYLLIVYLIGSLNIDSLLTHNSILFLILISFVTVYEKKDCFYSTGYKFKV